MNCCICGPVRNCGPYLTRVFENIEKLGSLSLRITKLLCIMINQPITH